MATRTETRFGETTALGTTYTNIGTVPSATVWNVLLNITNRTTALAKVRVYIADTSWSTGEPTGGTLKAAVAYDSNVYPGDIIQIPGFVMNATEKLIVRSDTASSLDITANGVAIV